MASQTSSSALTLPATHGFFKTFPRELRDNIYNLLILRYEKCDLNPDVYLAFVRISVPYKDLRLLDHQFKLEYDQACAQNKHINLAEFFIFNTFFVFDRTYGFTQDLLKCIVTMTVNFDISLEFAKSDIIDIATEVEEISLKVVKWFGAKSKPDKLEVLYRGEKSSRSGEILAVWTKQNGLVHDDEAVAQLERDEGLGDDDYEM